LADLSSSATAGIAELPLVAGLPLVEVREAILGWYRRLGRTLVFRRTRDPYHVLVLETMAQQTQVSRAADHWTTFIDRFPTFDALATASPADVLAAWRGLGYNRRAILLLRTARIVVAEHEGRLPSDIAALQRLPGIGPYTARAVAATAFGQPVGAVDTNVRRVLGRLVGGSTPLDSGSIQELADVLVPRDDPAHWTHALMDLGATTCLPRKPRCEACPLSAWCRFAREGNPASSAPRRRRGVAPFDASARWLRGRIIDRLRDAAGDGDDGWVRFEAAIGKHPAGSIGPALAALAQDGLIELRADTSNEARLPVA
jgi:A/G-specific adenine glycosylase